MQQLSAALAPLASVRQFIVCRFVPSTTRPGKTDKFPTNWRTGSVANAHDPAIWLSFDEAAQIAHQWGAEFGVGFVLTANLNRWVLDIDSCLQADGQWSPYSQQLCQYFAGCAIERSHSGNGVHVWGRGIVPEHACRGPGEIELYHTDRFIALGSDAVGNCDFDATHLLPSFVNQLFPPRQRGDVLNELADAPCAEWHGPTDDGELLRRALQSKSLNSTFGDRASFEDLWTGNVERLAKAFPDAINPYNASQADAALAQHLSFWTGRHGMRIERLMRISGLVRDKWLRDDYLPRTIAVACSQGDVLQDKPIEPPSSVVVEDDSGPVAPQMSPVEGNTFAGPAEQYELFKGCVYVSDANKVLVPGGMMLDGSRFKARYGGYTFSMDLVNERVERNAFVAFTESQAFRAPKVDSTCFRPLLPAGHIIKEAGRTRVNTYFDIQVPRKRGDPSRFLAHMAKLFPNERDRRIVLSYMAACVQHKGVKFKWAPLIQGFYGNGKSFLGTCLVEALGRTYCHLPRATEIGEKFNSWLFGSLLIVVEEILVQEHKAELMEILKEMITGEFLAKRAMQTDQVMQDVCCNFLVFSNHKNALLLARGDRRWAPLFTGQQSLDDINRDGMGGDYFPDLYEWARQGGYAVVTDLLHTYPIEPEFDPSGACHRAPTTSSTEQAIAASMGRIEQEVMEAIEQCQPGFCGGWVSSMALDRLLDAKGRGNSISPNKRRDMMRTLSYEWHPGLTDGRVNTVIMPDMGRPKLYVLKGSPAEQLIGPGEIARAYSLAQGGHGY